MGGSWAGGVVLQETEIPRGAEPMGIGAGLEGGGTPRAGTAPSLPFPGDPTARTQPGSLSTCSGFAAAPSLFSEPFLLSQPWNGEGRLKEPKAPR